MWRLHNLYWCVDENGKVFKFKPNEIQTDFLKQHWYFNVILKARQMGFTTLIDLMALDQCVFVPNFSAGIIAHNLEAAGRIFRDKIKYPWDHLPEGIKQANPLKRDMASELVWKNDSAIGVSVSMRSGTINFLHISEFGKIAKVYPMKAKEIRLGSFNAVHHGNHIFVESTAEGRGGDFYDMVVSARDQRDSKAPLAELDFKLHFYPWWQDARYVADPAAVRISSYLEDYFNTLAKKHGIKLTAEQKAWYASKARSLKSDSRASHGDMKQEFPSYEEEAFEAANTEKLYGEQMAAVRKSNRVCAVPHEEGIPVDTYWDMGYSDAMAVIFHQQVGAQDRILRGYANSGQSLKHYSQYLQRMAEEHGYTYGTHYLPHDAGAVRLGKDNSQTWMEMLQTLLHGHQFELVARVDDVMRGIQMTRNAFGSLWFDEEGTTELRRALDSYKKQWDERLGVYRDKPLHDWSSNYADALRQFGQVRSEGITRPVESLDDFDPNESWRTA